MIRITALVLPAVLCSIGCATFKESDEESLPGDHVTVTVESGERLSDAAGADTAREAGFTPAQQALLMDAIAWAEIVTADTSFRAIVREMEAAGEIAWGWKRRRLLPSGARQAPTAWLVDRFTTEGHYALEEIGVSQASYPPTTAVTTACNPLDPTCALETDISPRYVTSTAAIPGALANTLVHERVHSFGQQHGWSQKRGPNKCDAAYVMGDLAESLLRHRTDGAPIIPRETLCRSLQRRLTARRIVPP